MEGRRELLPEWGGGQSEVMCIRQLIEIAKRDAVKLSTHQTSTDKQYPKLESASRNRPGSPAERQREGQSETRGLKIDAVGDWKDINYPSQHI